MTTFTTTTAKKLFKFNWAVNVQYGIGSDAPVSGTSNVFASSEQEARMLLISNLKNDDFGHYGVVLPHSFMELWFVPSVEKIVTHGGTFHADEVLAIALHRLVSGLRLPVERKFKVSEEEIKDPRIMILDVGGVYEIAWNCFDHHQNGRLESTNVLLLSEYRDFFGPKLTYKLRKALFDHVSNVDRGIVVDGGANYGFNAIIRNLNNLENGFEVAMDMAETILLGYIATAKKAIEGEAIWAGFQKEGGIAIDPSGTIIPEWRELAKKDGVFFLLSPNSRGGFQIITRESEDMPIPSDSRQSFRHASGFMAVYANKEDAINHAMEMSSITS